MKIDVTKQLWIHNAKDFRVEVVRWTQNKINHWNVYAYLYPKHLLFEQITTESLFDYGINLPLHWGASYHRWNYKKDATVTYKCIGSDYQHLNDGEFESYESEKDACQVFKDADELIEYLKIKSEVSCDA